MGISEREYQEMLKRNEQLRVADDGRPSAPAAHPAAYRLTEVKLHADPAPTEHDEQCALFAWADANEGAHEELKLLFSIPNGGYRPVATAAMLKASGTKAGVPDCCLPVARGRFHSLWIEMKRKPNKPTEAQEQWITDLRRYGHMAVICYGAQDAISCILAYLAQE